MYFIRGGFLVARAKSSSFERLKESASLYDGSPMPAGKWMAKCIPPMQFARRKLSHRGFQSFRYVTASDGFGEAFD